MSVELSSLTQAGVKLEPATDPPSPSTHLQIQLSRLRGETLGDDLDVELPSDSKSSNRHKCNFCAKVLLSPASLKYHVETQHIRDARYKCTLCPYTTRRRFNLSRHMEGVHSLETTKKGQPKLTCAFCKERLKTWSGLLRHLKGRHEYVEPEEKGFQVVCFSCGVVIYEGFALYWSHIMEKHQVELRMMNRRCKTQDEFRELLQFVQLRSFEKIRNKNGLFLRCAMNGKQHGEAAPKWACPAMLNVTPYNGKFLISGCTTHSGHDHPADTSAAATAASRLSPSPNFASSSTASATAFPLGGDMSVDGEDSSTRSVKALLGELNRSSERPLSGSSSTHEDFAEQQDSLGAGEDGFSALERLFESTEANGPFSELIPTTNPMTSFPSSKSPSVSPPAPPPNHNKNKRDDYLSWEEFFMGTALLASQRSKDPNTQVGAVIVGEDNVILSIGYNGMPRGCSDDHLPWGKGADDPLSNKYLYVCHAEMNAVINKNAASLRKATIFTTLFPCNECAKIIIQAGIRAVVFLHDKPEKTEMKAARILFDMASVEYRQFRAGHNGIQLRFQ